MSYVFYPSLEGQTVVVTGGASGIGAEIVHAFAINKAKVAFLDVQADAAKTLIEDIGAVAHAPLFVKCDLTSIPDLQNTLVHIRDRLGLVSVLVNNAGNDDRHDVGDVTSEYWDGTLDINLKPQFFAAQAVHPDMKSLGGGAIINLSSIAWRRGVEKLAVYTAAKAAVVGLTHSLARAFGDDNIRVNAIEPGAVITERQRQLWYKSDAEVDAIADRQSIKRTLVAKDIARMALFLASDQSEMITKQSIIVDGGLA